MDDEDNDYELERQKTIAENRILLDSLGLDPSGASKIPVASSTTSKSKLAKPSSSTPAKKRKQPPAKTKIDDGPRRRSGRLAGLEATAEEVAKKEEEDEKEREILRVINKKTRDQVMDLQAMVDDSSPSEAGELETYLGRFQSWSNPRQFPDLSTSGKEAYAESDTLPVEVQRLKSAFKGMTLRANPKVTTDRVYTMVVHPEPTKTLVMVGDKYGMLGIWDALGRNEEKAEEEDDTSGVKEEDEDEEGRVWHVQAHARNSITCMKVDPINGSGLFSTSYDCSLRHLDFTTLRSTELFSFPDEDMLITHFDLMPNGQEAWMADKNGGINHCDFRESKRRGDAGRRRWEVQEEGRAAKLGGLSVNPLMPHLIVTAGNDQHVRIWDTRHLSHLNPKATDILTPPPTAVPNDVNGTNESHLANGEGGDPTAGQPDTAAHINTQPTSSIPYDKVGSYMNTNKGKGLLRANYQHGKSCSAAYWDPWGRRILTTSYDDKLRIWNLNPQSLLLDAPLAPTHFEPSRKIPHNCQTGRWLTILRAQWSLNLDYMPHFTIGNMKRSLDVIAATGDKIVSVWTDTVTAVPAATASHPSHVDHVVGGSTSGRIQLWMASGE